MGIRDTRRKSIPIERDHLFLNRSYFTSGFRQVVMCGSDQDIVLGKTQRDIRADEINRLNRLNNFYYLTDQTPVVPQVVTFDI